MKISDVSIEDIKQYANIYHNEDDNLISSIITAAKSYIRNYTGLTDEQMDQKEDLTIALMVLCSEMYDNRAFTVEDSKVNSVIKSILDMHSINLL
ncbi:MAG: head-tail connector protein [Caloramator sp.]|nr:head-tail connector protein [Caloramator sp.]